MMHRTCSTSACRQAAAAVDGARAAAAAAAALAAAADLPRESDHIVYINPTHVTLSTYFLADVGADPATASAGLGGLMPLTNLANASRASAADITNASRALGLGGVLAARADAPLPCRTGDTPSRCLDGLRQCGTTEANTGAPFAEVDLVTGYDTWPTDRDYYFLRSSSRCRAPRHSPTCSSRATRATRPAASTR